VECGRDFVHFKVATKRAFRGRVYVKGEFDNPKCVQSMVDEGEEDVAEDSPNDVNRRKGGGNGNSAAADGNGNGHNSHHFGGKFWAKGLVCLIYDFFKFNFS
jgi:hypothetical protein